MRDIPELTLIGMKYHYNTESWDRIHDHGIAPSGETAMPKHRGGSSSNAYMCRDEAMDEGVRKGFTPQEVIKAIRDTAQYKYEEICEILDRTCFPL
jgi:hypothetical protein